HALLLLHVRHDPRRRALAADSRRGTGAAVGHHGVPARVRDAPRGLRRAVRGQALGPPGVQVRHRTRHLVLDEELPDRDRGRRPRGTRAGVPVLRPGAPAPPSRTGLVEGSGAAVGAAPANLDHKALTATTARAGEAALGFGGVPPWGGYGGAKHFRARGVQGGGPTAGS